MTASTPRFRALFLDLDETLLDNSRHQGSVVRTCAQIAAHRPELDATRLLEANGNVWRSYWAEVEDRWNLGSLDGVAVRLEAWRRTLLACGCGDESIARLAVSTHQQLARETYRLFGDVVELFDFAKRTGVPLALITNGASDTQREKLRVLRIEQWFGAVVVSGEVGIAKPDASVFGVALNELAIDCDGVWHVGDNLATDVAGAKAAGLTAVWLNRNGRLRKDGDPEPDIEIASLSNLTGFIAE